MKHELYYRNVRLAIYVGSVVVIVFIAAMTVGVMHDNKLNNDARLERIKQCRVAQVVDLCLDRNR